MATEQEWRDEWIENHGAPFPYDATRVGAGNTFDSMDSDVENVGRKIAGLNTSLGKLESEILRTREQSVANTERVDAAVRDLAKATREGADAADRHQRAMTTWTMWMAFATIAAAAGAVMQALGALGVIGK